MISLVQPADNEPLKFLVDRLDVEQIPSWNRIDRKSEHYGKKLSTMVLSRLGLLFRLWQALVEC